MSKLALSVLIDSLLSLLTDALSWFRIELPPFLNCVKEGEVEFVNEYHNRLSLRL